MDQLVRKAMCSLWRTQHENAITFFNEHVSAVACSLDS